MSQFCVHANADPASRRSIPCWLDIQSDLIAETGTRVVVPMLPVPGEGPSPAMSGLAPVLEVGGQAYVLVVPLLAAVEVAGLGPVEADLSSERATIMAALDILISGI